MLTRLSTSFWLAILLLLSLQMDTSLCHTTQSLASSTASHNGDMTSLIVVLSFVAVIGLIGMIVLLYYCYCISPSNNKDNNMNDLEKGAASYELPSDGQQERGGSDKTKPTGRVLMEGGSSANIRTPTKQRRKKKRKRDGSGGSKQTLQTRQRRRSTTLQSNLNVRRVKPKDAPKKARDNKPKERAICQQKQEGLKKRNCSKGLVLNSPLKVRRVKSKRREPKSGRRESAHKVRGGRSHERHSKQMSDSKVYGEGLELYRNILKSVHSVKSVSQYFQNNN